MDKLVSWSSRVEGHGAYAIKSRHLVTAMEERGWEILINEHIANGELAPYHVSCHYPPRYPTLKFDRTLCITTWEFSGDGATPARWLPVFDAYDVVWAACAFAGEVFRNDGVDNAADGFLGVDGEEFSPEGEVYELPAFIPKHAYKLLWVGGTDMRHGFDVARAVLAELPEDVWLIAKQHPEYPVHKAIQERLVVITDDLPSLAPLYRSCDLFLHTARAAGTSMPVMEALASGLEVVSGRLPSVEEYGEGLVHWVEVTDHPMRHHIHQDCVPRWRIADPAWFAAAVEAARSERQPRLNSPEKAEGFSSAWSWAAAARNLERALIGEGDV